LEDTHKINPVEANLNEQEDKSEHLLVLGDASFSGDGIDGLTGIWPDDYPIAVLDKPDIFPE